MTSMKCHWIRQTSFPSALIPSSYCVFPQSLQRSRWRRPILMLKWVRTPGCSAPRHMTPHWTLPSSGPWMAASLTYTKTVNTMSAPQWDIILIIKKRNEHKYSMSSLIVPTFPQLQDLSYSLEFIHGKIYLRLGFQARRVIFEVGSFCNILVGIPEMEKYSLLWMNMTLKAISHSFPEWNSALYVCLIAIWANIHYCWHDVLSLSLLQLKP